MKNVLVFLFFITASLTAQTTKDEKIFNTAYCTVSCMETFENDSLVSAYITLEAKDDRSATLRNFFTLCYDTPQNVYKFLFELEKLGSGNTGTTSMVNGHRIDVEKVTGPKDLKVFDERGVVFHRFLPSQVISIKTRLHEWAVTMKIDLD